MALAVGVFTSWGAGFISKRVIQSISGAKKLSWEKIEGNLAKGVVYENLKIENIEVFPLPNRLRIGKLFLEIDGLDAEGLTFSIENALLNIPDSEPVLFFGKLKQGQFDFNIYSRRLSLEGLNNFIGSKDLRTVKGTFADLDIFLKGSMSEPLIDGSFVVDHLRRDGFSLADSHCRLNLTVRKKNESYGLWGDILFSDGIIKGQKTATVGLESAKISFLGDFKETNLDLTAAAIVEKVRISISVKGRLVSPELSISSDSKLNQNRLLLALATNQLWSGIDSISASSTLPPDLAADFMNYFVFGGTVNELAKKLGIKDVSIIQEPGKTGFSLKKGIIPGIDAVYSLENSTSKTEKSPPSQSIGLEYNILNNLSLEANKEIIPINKNELDQTNKDPNDSLRLKYKKSF